MKQAASRRRDTGVGPWRIGRAFPSSEQSPKVPAMLGTLTVAPGLQVVGRRGSLVPNGPACCSEQLGLPHGNWQRVLCR